LKLILSQEHSISIKIHIDTIERFPAASRNRPARRTLPAETAMPAAAMSASQPPEGPSQLILDTGAEFLETAPMFDKSRRILFYTIAILACALVLCFYPAAGPAPGSAQTKPGETVEYLVRTELTGTRGGNLVASIRTDPANFSRLFASGMANAIVSDQLSADLVHINRQSYELEPSLATRWEAEKDGRTYTVHLRRGLRFSDGSPFTADDVVFTLNALQDPRLESSIADQLRVDGKFPAVTRIDANTVRIVLPRPVGTGLRAFDSIPILPRNRLLKSWQDGTLAQAWSPSVAPGEVSGLGPFRLREYQRGIRIVFERNPYYWKKDKAGQTLPYLDTLTLVILQDRNAEALRFQAGEIDLLGAMSPEHFVSLRGSDRAKDYSLQDLGPGLGMDFLWFNLNSGKNPAGAPLLDPEKRAVFEQASFRRAVSGVLNRDGMVRSLLLNLGTPQYGPISSGNKIWHQGGPRPAAPDVKQAKALLAQIGLKEADANGILLYGTRRRPLEFVLLTDRGNATRENTAEIIKQDLTQIGVRVNIQLLLQNEVASRFMGSFEYEAILFGLTPTDVVPDLQTDLWYSKGRFHFWHPNQSVPSTPWEAEIDALIGRMVQSLDSAARKNFFLQVQEIWAKQMPAIATMAPNILVGWNKTVGNVRPTILVPYLLWNTEELTKRSR
jgi:peptide/nickel transport system substrate-binding protein